jgi:hypothetical protein
MGCLRLYFGLRRGGGGRRDRHILCHEAFHHACHRTHPQHVGIGLFCWLIFTLAVYALPFFIGLTAGMAAFHSGAGVLGALTVGIVAGAVTLAIGQIAFAVVRPPVLRAVIAAAFAIPAAIAGYHAVLGLSQIGVPSLVWRETFAWSGALFIGGTAWARMTVFAEPLPLRPDVASQLPT